MTRLIDPQSINTNHALTISIGDHISGRLNPKLFNTQSNK
jgi:hypothetical protein